MRRNYRHITPSKPVCPNTVRNLFAKTLSYAFALILILLITSNVAAQKIYEISGNNSFTGAATYCRNAAASNLTVIFNTCNTGSGTPTVSNFTITWYYNTTNSTSIIGATQVQQSATNTGTSSTQTFTYIPLTTAAGSYYYFVVLSSPSSTTCGFTGTLTTSATQLVTVNSPPAISTQPTSQIVCAGFNGTFSVVATGSAPLTYQWRKSTVNISGAISNSYSTNITGSYDVVITNSCGSVTSSAVTLSNPATMAGGHNVTAITACVGYNPNITLQFNNTALSGGLAPYTYQWRLNGIAIAGETSPTYAPPVLSTTGTYSYNCIVTDACGTTLSSTAKVITIVSDPTVSISGNTPVCQNSSLTLTANVTGGTGSNIYQWQSGTSSTGPWTDISGETLANYSPSTVSAGTFYYKIVRKGGAACSQPTDVATVIVNANPSVNSVANQIVCNGTSTTAITFSGSIPGTVYNWTNNTTTIGLAASGTGDIASFLASNSSSTAVTATITVTPVMTYGSLNCTGPPQSFTITVNPSPTVTTSNTKIICNGVSTNISLSSNIASSFSWTIGTITGGITGASSSSGSTINQILTNPSTTTSGSVQYIVTPTSITGSCVGAPFTIIVTVDTKPTITLQPLDKQTCKDVLVSFTATASGSPAPTVQWYVNSNPVSNGSTYSGVTTNTLTFTAIRNMDGDKITAVFTNSCGTVTSSQALLTVGAPLITSGDATIRTSCSGTGGSDVTLTASANGGQGTLTGQFLVSTDNGVTWIIIPGTTVTTNTGNLTINYTIAGAASGNLYRAQFINQGCAENYSPTTTLIINPPPTMTKPPDVVVCKSQNVNVDFSTYATNATSFTWTNSNTAIGLASNGTTNPLSFTATNATASPITATITVTPVYTGGSVSCSGTSQTFTITVNPTPVAPTGISGSNCGTGTVSLGASGCTGTLNWYAAASGGSSIGTGTPFVTPTISTTTTYYVSCTSASGCEGPRTAVVATINAIPVAPTAGPNSRCGTGTVSLTASNCTGTLNWYSAASGGSSIGTGSPFVTPSISSTTSYWVSCTSAAGCEGPRTQVTATINTIPVVTVSPASATICAGGSTIFTASGANTYTWSPTTGLSPTTGAVVTANPASTTTYTVTGTAVNGCTNTQTVTVSVNNVTSGSILDDQTLCSGGIPAPFTIATAATGAGTLSYQWEISTTSAVAGFTDIAGATSATYSPPLVSQATWYRRITTSTLNGVSCNVTTNVLAVSLFPITAGSITSSQTICSGTAPTSFTSASANAPSATNFTYQWQSSISPFSTWTNVGSSSSSAISYTSPILTQTTQFRVSVRGIKSGSNGFDCTVYSNIITVTINSVSAGTVGSNQTICNAGDPAIFTVTTAATGAGALSYQWQSSTTGCSGPWSNISGATSSTYDIPAGLTTTTYYQLVVSSLLNGVSCTANSNCITVTVNPIPTCSIAGSDPVCSGTTNTYSSTILPAGGTVTHSWSITGAGTISGSTTGATVTVIAITVCASSTFTITDNISRDGCVTICSKIVTVNPPPLPVFNAATPITVACGGAVTSSLSYTNSASGSCLISGSVTSTLSPLPTACGGTVTETWTFTDACNRTITQSRTITVSPAALPTMTALAAITVACGSIPVSSTINFSNGLSGVCLISGTSNTSTFTASPAACGGTVTETWTATDACGRALTAVSRTITVSPATLPTMAAQANITVACGSIPISSTISYSNGLSGGCLISGNSNSSTFSASPAACGGTVTETWTATDACGRAMANVSRTITVSPSALPTMIALANITVACAALPAASTISYSNGLSGGCLISGNSNSSTFSATPTACGGTVTETWTATDICGRALTAVSRTITISPAALPTMTAPANITVACGSVPAASTISYTNGLSGGCMISGVSNNSTFTGLPVPATGGTVTETWTATDACGRTIISVSRQITVGPGSTANAGGPEEFCELTVQPVITLSGASVGGGATTGAWSITLGSGTLSTTAQTGSPSSVTFTPAVGFNGPVQLTLTSNAAGACPPATSVRNITIKAKPVPIIITHN